MNNCFSARKKLCVFLIVLISLVIIPGCVWYEFFDVTGLTLYDDEPISKIIPFEKRVYLITEDGYGYVAGDYNSDSRLYRNSEFHHNEKLGIPSPVKFHSEKIKQLFPFRRGALFVTENDSLYKLNDITAKFISNDIVYADQAGEIIYAIDISKNLYSIDAENRRSFLCADVKMVKAYRERIFVLCNNGALCELIRSDSGYAVSSPIFEDVKAFDVLDTSERYDGTKFIYDDENAIKTPLFNVLTNENQLYVKGVYNLLSCSRLASAFPSLVQFDEWTLIEEEVSDFSLAPMGTVYVKMDSSCAYFGFDSDMRSDVAFEVKYKKLLESGVEYATTSKDCCIYVKTKDNKYYMWGSWSTLLFDQHSDDHHIFTGEPFVLEP